MEQWIARLHQESLSHREKQAEQDIEKYTKMKETLQAAERYAKASVSLSGLVDRVEKLETETLNMLQYDALLSRLLRLEFEGANKNEVNELRDAMSQLGKTTAKTSQIEDLSKRSDDIAERLELIESAKPSASVIEQATKQIGVVEDLTRIVKKVECFQKTEAQISKESNASNSSDVLDLTLLANSYAKILSAHHEDIISLQKEAKVSCAVLQALKGMLERVSKGESPPIVPIDMIKQVCSMHEPANCQLASVLFCLVFQPMHPAGLLILMKLLLKSSKH